MPLIELVKRGLNIGGPANNVDVIVLMAAVLPLSIAIGITSYGFLEEPFRRWARRKRRPARREPAAVRRRAALAGAQQW
jgi:peptidoglycan/LPS O-acetylase OafA/YrhL